MQISTEVVFQHLPMKTSGHTTTKYMMLIMPRLYWSGKIKG